MEMCSFLAMTEIRFLIKLKFVPKMFHIVVYQTCSPYYTLYFMSFRNMSPNTFLELTVPYIVILR